MATGALAATPRTTEEGVTSGGHSAIGVGLHAAEALTPGSQRQAVRGQESKAREGSASQADSAASSQGSGQPFHTLVHIGCLAELAVFRAQGNF